MLICLLLLAAPIGLLYLKPWVGPSVGCFGLIYPVLLLIFLTRPKVVAAFRPPARAASRVKMVFRARKTWSSLQVA